MGKQLWCELHDDLWTRRISVQTRDFKVNLNFNVTRAPPLAFVSSHRHFTRPWAHSRDRYTDGNESYTFVPDGVDAQALTINRSSGEVALNRTSSVASKSPNQTLSMQTGKRQYL